MENIVIYLKFYFANYINKSRDLEKKLIMNLYEFKNIITIYFSLISSVCINSYIKVYSAYDSDSLKLKQIFNTTNIISFTNDFLTDYVKKNFYINVGRLLDEQIHFLVDDKQIRKTIYLFITDRTNYLKLIKTNRKQRKKTQLNKVNI
jgi:hypothetical protein